MTEAKYTPEGLIRVSVESSLVYLHRLKEDYEHSGVFSMLRSEGKFLERLERDNPVINITLDELITYFFKDNNLNEEETASIRRSILLGAEITYELLRLEALANKVEGIVEEDKEE